ncbi:MAG: ABC transporter transmembrane domain-containing protein, partial [Planctomycetota bacterium]
LAQEGLSQIRMVHAFGREAFEVGQFSRRAAQSLEANMRLNMTSVASALVVGTLMALGTALMYYVGSVQVLQSKGTFTLGDLLVFASYLVMLYQPLEQLTYTAWALEGAAAVRKISLYSSPVTDGGMAYLAALPNLEELSLSHTAVTDACLPGLAKLPRLKRLDLSSTGVTPAALADLKKARPELKVTYSPPKESK